MTKANTTVKAAYPILTLVLAMLLLAYFYLQSQADLLAFYSVPEIIYRSPMPEAWVMLFIAVAWLELRAVLRRREQQQLLLDKANQQIEELLANKKQLNAKAHVYANHADKLKLFISDKLLEYIEYDEKFLHFKSIASEVRHNGVISYDKVTSLLQNAMDQLVAEDERYSELKDARNSLRFLWDLLDLSTADNIALHIANQVCESEELLFQSELNDDSAPLVNKPVFDAKSVLLNALARCFGSNPLLDEDGSIHIEDQSHVYIQCSPAEPLLGNENHIILALENIINNAQFFAGRRGSRRVQRLARIAVQLDQSGDYIRYRVYNRGPHIDEDNALKLFQLGYSTRRVKQHHGKGLGLYFVNEIVKGYDGVLSFRNIYNQSDTLSLRLELDSGEIITDMIEVVVEDGVPQCRKTGGDSLDEQHQWPLSGALLSVEITHQSDQKTHRILADQLTQKRFHDPVQSAFPRWCLSMEKPNSLTFMPLDTAGVSFQIKLPSVTARLEGDLLDTDEEHMDQQIAKLTTQFKSLED